VYKEFGKDHVCGSGNILADRQTHRQSYSSQYFTTAPTGEAISITCIKTRPLPKIHKNPATTF